MVSFLVCVNDDDHLIQMSNLGLLVMESVHHPEVYVKKNQRQTHKESQYKLMIERELTMGA